MIANVSGPAIEMSVIGIPVSTRIPSDDSPTSLSDHWCKDIESAREIKTSVHHRNDWSAGLAPLVQRESKTTAIDRASAIRRFRPRKFACLISFGHVCEPRSPPPAVCIPNGRRLHEPWIRNRSTCTTPPMSASAATDSATPPIDAHLSMPWLQLIAQSLLLNSSMSQPEYRKVPRTEICQY